MIKIEDPIILSVFKDKFIEGKNKIIPITSNIEMRIINESNINASLLCFFLSSFDLQLILEAYHMKRKNINTKARLTMKSKPFSELNAKPIKPITIIEDSKYV